MVAVFNGLSSQPAAPHIRKSRLQRSSYSVYPGWITVPQRGMNSVEAKAKMKLPHQYSIAVLAITALACGACAKKVAAIRPVPRRRGSRLWHRARLNRPPHGRKLLRYRCAFRCSNRVTRMRQRALALTSVVQPNTTCTRRPTGNRCKELPGSNWNLGQSTLSGELRKGVPHARSPMNPAGRRIGEFTLLPWEIEGGMTLCARLLRS
jgi:hypothetical protein